jgi:predicted ester cyclase
MTWSAVQVEDIPDIPATGRSFEIRGIAIDYFKDGKVIKHLPLFDQLNMMQQLGAMSKPSPAGKKN